MVNYKLTYFNIRGRAEASRLILAAAGVEYEDERVAGEKWPQLKPKTPFGQMPVLCVDGKTEIAESMAIARYLAKAHGLSGKSALDEARADMIACSANDLLEKLYEKVIVGKEEEKKEFFSETLPKYLCNLEKLLKCNHDGKGYLVGDGLTHADLAVYNTLEPICCQHPSALDCAPLIKAHVERIGNLPKIKCWVEKRPKTDM